MHPPSARCATQSNSAVDLSFDLLCMCYGDHRWATRKRCQSSRHWLCCFHRPLDRHWRVNSWSLLAICAFVVELACEQWPLFCSDAVRFRAVVEIDAPLACYHRIASGKHKSRAAHVRRRASLDHRGWSWWKWSRSSIAAVAAGTQLRCFWVNTSGIKYKCHRNVFSCHMISPFCKWFWHIIFGGKCG